MGFKAADLLHKGNVLTYQLSFGYRAIAGNEMWEPKDYLI